MIAGSGPVRTTLLRRPSGCFVPPVRLLLRDSSKVDLKQQELEVPEWGGFIVLQSATMADLEEKRSGEFLFDRTYLSTTFATLSGDVRRMIDSVDDTLKMLADGTRLAPLHYQQSAGTGIEREAATDVRRRSLDLARSLIDGQNELVMVLRAPIPSVFRGSGKVLVVNDRRFRTRSLVLAQLASEITERRLVLLPSSNHRHEQAKPCDTDPDLHL